MKNKSCGMLAILVSVALIFSCDRKQLEEIAPANTKNSFSNNSTPSTQLNSKLIYEETFEFDNIFSGLHQQFGTTYAFQVANTPVYKGLKAGRFELRDSDPMTSGGTRSEILFPEITTRDRWYSFAAYYPSNEYTSDSNNDILSQWHQGGGTSPSTTFRVKSDRFFMKIGNTKETRKDFDLGAQTKNVWHEFVIHIIHSYSTDGLVEVWHNGNKVLTYRGGNMYNTNLPRWKIGIYKDNWNYDRTTNSKLRVFYLDNIRMGNETASLSDMVSGIISTPLPTEPTPTEPTPTPTPTTPVGTQSITGFTLINTSTEKDVMPLVNGSIITLSSIGTSRLNFRANTTKTVGSVKFVLSGTQNHSYIDNAVPYAIFGDNGKGNYYHGSWIPKPGSYTLTATSYTGAKGTGTAELPHSITFTIR